ncbi:uroporphyrinogen-III synthase [Pseudoluteimonas lycopersici]|uniref:Uroporphyrinogen-III synthase n=2 Tax=Pseudoluteimonas lycopersici TaxID=1324796 RepID=A0A516V8F6_9GAMM|nr:uroporphyrinogen-III synthase [Lysobacter lycopersici]
MPLARCYVISLRPVGAHESLRRAAAARGARVLALSSWRIETQDDAGTRRALRAALAADLVIATSPAAVRATAALQALKRKRGQRWCAVGAGTAAALRRAGIDAVVSPSRMDSEGLLALAELQSLHGRGVGLLTAPGGRNVIAPTLRKRGAHVLRADVYRRVEIPFSSASLSRFRALRAKPWLALGSGEALQQALTRLPADLADKLRAADVAAASERLAQAAREFGFQGRIAVAASARPRDLVAAMAAAIG